MAFKKNKFYRDGSFHHLYIKSIGGKVLFYRTEDYLFYYTLFSILARRYGIRTDAFCIMFNHTHSDVRACSYDDFYSFCRDLLSLFTVGYNKEYRLKGRLLMPCGYAPKPSGKQRRTCLIYIANNPVSGRLVKMAPEYKWNLLAYLDSDHPFSEKLIKRKCRFSMRQSLALVDRSFNRGKWLNYTLLERIFKKLDPKEKRQMIDYIIVRYFFLDKDEFVSQFESLEKALLAMDSTTGSENNLFEPWEDYSVYLKMLKTSLASGLDIKQFRFHEMSPEEREILADTLSKIPGTTMKHIHRFLHLNEP